jgi:hypothetical protein
MYQRFDHQVKASLFRRIARLFSSASAAAEGCFGSAKRALLAVA